VRGLGFCAESDRRARSDAVRGEESGPSLEKKLTDGAQASAGEGGENVPVRKRNGVGPWASSGAGPKGSPRPFFYFCLFFFLFFC
jgi:hypothetical protein